MSTPTTQRTNPKMPQALDAGHHDGWRSTTLEEVADIEMGQSPPGNTYNDRGDGLPFLQGSAEFSDRYPMPNRWCSAPKKIAEPGDLLISVRAPVGDTNIAHTQVAFGRGLARVRSTDQASADYLRLVIQSEVNRLNQSASGTTFASITAKNLRGFPVLVPPLAEQRRIVEVVEEHRARLDAAESGLESCGTRLSQLKHSILQRAHTGLGSEGCRENWQSTTLGEVTVINPESVRGWSDDSAIRYVDISSVSESKGIDIANLKSLRLGEAPSRAQRVIRSDDVIVSTVRPNLRAFALIDAQLNGEVASTAFAVLRAGAEVVPGYIWCIVRSQSFVDYLMTRVTGSSYPAVRAANIAAYKFDLPSLTEQRHIVSWIEEHLKDMGRLEHTVDTAIGQTASLQRAILAAALKGRLTSEDLAA